jgi:thioredoxin-related protein
MTKAALAAVVLFSLVLGGALSVYAGETTLEIMGKDLVGTEVFISGNKAGVIKEQVGELGHFTSKIQPGKSKVELKKGGQTVWSREIQVEKGSDYCIEASLEGSVSAGGSDSASYSEEIYWRYNLAEALKLAAQEKKPLMVDFYATWCGWCRKLDSDVYTDPDVRRLAARFISVKVDTDQYKEEAKRYRVGGLPTIVFLDSSGAEVQRIGGYQPKEAFCQIMEQVAPKETKKSAGNAAPAASKNTVAAPAATTASTAGSTSALIKNKINSAKKKAISVIDRWAK